jgi:hypothetical protein
VQVTDLPRSEWLLSGAARAFNRNQGKDAPESARRSAFFFFLLLS